MRQVDPGQRYYITIQKAGGRLITYKEHEWCREASDVVAGYMHRSDLEDGGMPRVIDFEVEDFQTVQAESPRLYAQLHAAGLTPEYYEVAQCVR